MPDELAIHSKAPPPAGVLSNFAAHCFYFRGVSVASMEGLLQAVKHPDPRDQLRCLALSGAAAKKAGRRALAWRQTRCLHWQGTTLNRDGEDYQAFLDDAYWALFTGNPRAAVALMDTRDAVLTHPTGSNDPAETVLTSEEFCARLTWIRHALLRVDADDNQKERFAEPLSGVLRGLDDGAKAMNAETVAAMEKALERLERRPPPRRRRPRDWKAS